MTPYIIQPNGNNANDLVTHIWYWGRFVANIAKTKPQQQQIILQFSLLISYKLHLFFKMSNNNLFKTYFGYEKYWFLGWNISNLKKTFLSKNPVLTFGTQEKEKKRQRHTLAQRLKEKERERERERCKP